MYNTRILALISLAAIPFAASAADLGLARDYNAFIFGNSTFNGNESEGPVAVGGNYTVNAGHNTDIFHINGPTVGALTNATLLVGGDFIANGDAHLEWGNGYVGGNFKTNSHYDLHNSSTLNIHGAYTNLSGGAGPSQNNAFNLNGPAVAASLFTDQKAYSATQSSLISALGTNFGNSIEAYTPSNQNDQNKFQVKNHAGVAVGYGDQNNLNINLSSFTPLAGIAGQSVYVFNIDKSLVAGGSLNLNWGNIPSTSTVLVNVTGGGTINWGIKNATNTKDRILYNLGTAFSFSVGGNDEFSGSILAPFADVLSTKRINGNLIAQTATFTGTELHWGNNASYKFGGWVPAAVPEPGTWAALGLGAVALLRRRRK